MASSIQLKSGMLKSRMPAMVVALAVLGLCGLALPTTAGEQGPTVSAASAKALKAAQDATKTKNFAEVIKKAQEVLASDKKTPYDSYVAQQMLAYAYASQGNQGEAAKAVEAQLESGFVPPAEVNGKLRSLTGIAYQQKNYPKAVELGNRLIRNGGADAEIYTIIAQAHYLQGKYNEAGKFMADFVEDQEKRGQTPKEQSLILARGAFERAENAAGATDALEKLVMHYPKPDYWNALLYTLRRDPKLTDRQTLHIYRLMQATNTMKAATDYTEMAELAVSSGNPAEAQRVLEQGLGTPVFAVQVEKDRGQRMLESSRKAAVTDKASLPKLESEAASAKTGDSDVALGTAYLGFGENAKALEAFQRGITKGGLKNPADAQLMLGIAHVRAGSKPEALKAFRAGKSEDPIIQRLLKLWTLYASN